MPVQVTSCCVELMIFSLVDGDATDERANRMFPLSSIVSNVVQMVLLGNILFILFWLL